ncbi:MAG TPA: RNA 2',3'-cyclic phosphodiesterase [Candidatus Limnocylindrales bacterium]
MARRAGGTAGARRGPGDLLIGLTDPTGERPARLFVAIPVPSAVGERVATAAEQLPASVRTSLRWLPSEALHVTLRFLGATPRALIPGIGEAVRAPAADQEAFPLWIDGPALVLARSGVLALRLADAEPLIRLRDQLDATLERIGVAREGRPFRAHVTVARSRGRQRVDRSVTDVVAAAVAGTGWRAEEVVLFESHLGPAGARHDRMVVAALGPRPAAGRADGRIGEASGQRPTAQVRGSQSTCRSPSERASSPPSDYST